jgi:multicomponent Na+:H+ antiporter subunit D
LGFTALGFFLLLKHLDPEPKISLDTDWFYRLGSERLLEFARGHLAQFEIRFVGEIYESVVKWPVLAVADLLRKLDSGVVDALALSVGGVTQAFSKVLRTTVSGNAQHYGLIMAAGIVALLVMAMLA